MNKRVAKKILGGSNVSLPRRLKAKKIMHRCYIKYQGDKRANLTKWEPTHTTEKYY